MCPSLDIPLIMIIIFSIDTVVDSHRLVVGGVDEQQLLLLLVVVGVAAPTEGDVMDLSRPPVVVVRNVRQVLGQSRQTTSRNCQKYVALYNHQWKFFL